MPVHRAGRHQTGNIRRLQAAKPLLAAKPGGNQDGRGGDLPGAAGPVPQEQPGFDPVEGDRLRRVDGLAQHPPALAAQPGGNVHRNHRQAALVQLADYAGSPALHGSGQTGAEQRVHRRVTGWQRVAGRGDGHARLQGQGAVHGRVAARGRGQLKDHRLSSTGAPQPGRGIAVSAVVAGPADKQRPSAGNPPSQRIAHRHCGMLHQQCAGHAAQGHIVLLQGAHGPGGDGDLHRKPPCR